MDKDGKEGFTRYSMRENMLKKVLIRIDYDGVTDINRGSGGQELLFTLSAQYIPSKIVIHA